MHRTPTRTIGVAAVALIWTLLTLGLYYWVHKPFDAALAGALGGAVLDLAVTGLFTVIAGGLGRRLLRRFDFAMWGRVERVAAECLVGLAALSLPLLAVGFVVLHALSVGAVLLLVAVLTLPDLRGWSGDAARVVRGGLPPRGWARVVAGIVVALVGMALILSVLPPTQWDTLTYHLTGPLRYVEHGRFYRVTGSHFLGFPQLVETLYTAQVALTGRLTASASLHWVMGVCMLLLTGGFTARHAGRAAGWLAAAMLVVAYTVWLELYEAYVDLMLMGLAAVMLAVTEAWVTRRGSRAGLYDLALLGALAGWSMGVKYTAIWLVAGFGVLIVWLSWRDGVCPLLARAALYGGVAALVLLPWLVRNTIWYHNPVYPFFFPSIGLDEVHQTWYVAPGTGLVPTGRAWHIPLLPFMATVFGVEGGVLYQADIGPMFMFLVPLLALGWGRLGEDARGLARRVLLVCGVIVAAWMVSAAFGSFYNIQSRLVFYMLPLLAVLGGLALDGLDRLPPKPFDVAFVLRAMVVLVLVFTLIHNGREFVTSGLHVYFSGRDDYRAAYLDHVLGWTNVAWTRVNDLEPGTDVWFLWEPRALYCDEDRVNCQPDWMLDLWYHARRTIGSGDPADIAAVWQAEGADALLVFESGRRFEIDRDQDYTPEDWAAWDAFVAEHLDEIWRGGPEEEAAYILYRWRPDEG